MIKSIIRRIINNIRYTYCLKTKGYDEAQLIKLEYYIKKGMKIGKNCGIFNCNIDYFFPYLIEIGNDVVISHSTILTHDASIKKELGKSKIGSVKIGNNVFIGYGSIVLPNVTIGDNVIVGAGSVISKNIPNNVVVAGVPTKVICTYEEYIEKNKVLMTPDRIFSNTNNKLNYKEIEQMKIIMKKGIAFND